MRRHPPSIGGKLQMELPTSHNRTSREVAHHEMVGHTTKDNLVRSEGLRVYKGVHLGDQNGNPKLKYERDGCAKFGTSSLNS